ncbi:energy-coupling factor transporter ATP-binding protein EcfA2 [Arthrobacter sp. PvP023]|uniref:GTPase n=1 Tax=Micrococcaceae TaxID=1268 RepID=UPI001AE1EB75|nr:GTPase [Arthrobacter sp. PvP023]MBP1135061.1 energy-coupling factor transporter ATP-binding protein EcfA2 [Arthrobacter sp. PvP023]
MSELSEAFPDLRSAALRLLDDVEGLVGLPGAPIVDGLRLALGKPAVVAVTGRVNTGKSTLVNSLIGAKMAPTSAQETTALLSYYSFGAPARAEAVMKAGQIAPLPLAASGPMTGSIPPATIEYLRIYLQAAVLERSTIIDTPGLGSAATDNSARTESGMLGDSNTPVDPDVLLFLIRDELRPDDETFISSYRERHGHGSVGGVGATEGVPGRVPVIGLVAHADNFGGGPWHTADPIEAARTAATGLTARMPQLTAVLPISGLLAESVRTGALREQDVRVLRALQAADATQLQFAEQLGPPPGVRKEDFQRLTALIGSYGIRFGREHCGSAGQLTAWLNERSGLTQLERVLQSEVTGPIESARVEAVLTGLQAAARANSWPSPARLLVESARHAPAFHRLQEVAALALLRTADPEHELVAVLEGLTKPAPLLPDVGPTPNPGPAMHGGNRYLELASHYQSMVGTASTGAEARAARVIARSLLIRSETPRSAT